MCDSSCFIPKKLLAYLSFVKFQAQSEAIIIINNESIVAQHMLQQKYSNNQKFIQRKKKEK